MSSSAERFHFDGRFGHITTSMANSVIDAAYAAGQEARHPIPNESKSLQAFGNSSGFDEGVERYVVKPTMPDSTVTWWYVEDAVTGFRVEDAREEQHVIRRQATRLNEIEAKHRQELIAEGERRAGEGAAKAAVEEWETMARTLDHVDPPAEVVTHLRLLRKRLAALNTDNTNTEKEQGE